VVERQVSPPAGGLILDPQNRCLTSVGTDVPVLRVGVSRAAVSFVLNNRPDTRVSAETRRRIIQAVDDLGYRPNAGARALAARRSGLLGMVTEIVTSSFGPDTVRGAKDQAWNAGMLLTIAASEGRPEMEVLAVERLLEQRVEGLIFASGAHQAVTVPTAASERLTVLMHCFDADQRLPAVLPDEEGGGYIATRRLLDAGHQRIGRVNQEAHTAAARADWSATSRPSMRWASRPIPRS